jgi:hypothetical protein
VLEVRAALSDAGLGSAPTVDASTAGTQDVAAAVPGADDTSGSDTVEVVDQTDVDLDVTQNTSTDDGDDSANTDVVAATDPSADLADTASVDVDPTQNPPASP